MANIINLADVHAINSEKFEQNVIELSVLKTQAKALDEQIKELEELVKLHMDALNIQELEAAGHKVTYKEVTANRFDTTRFKNERPEDYKKFLKESTYKRFELK